jgi:hypothetical protein
MKMGTQQLDLIPSSTHPLLGLQVKIETHAKPCCSEGAIAVIGLGAGPHHSRLICESCGQHRGWLSRETAGKIEDIIKQFGRPTEPIIIRR